MIRSVSLWFPPLLLVILIALLLFLASHPRWRRLFRWLPIPLWCYGVPMVLGAMGVLPAEHPSYRLITDHLFPIALGLLLVGVDVPGLRRLGAPALLAMLIGSAGIVVAGPVMAWIVRPMLPPEAWKGIGTLAATWTGGSLNMLALRSVLNVPQTIFAPLVVIDALVAYSWMACLIWCQGVAPTINRWLRASEDLIPLGSNSQTDQPPRQDSRAMMQITVLSVALAVASRVIARQLPSGGLVVSATGWGVLLVTTIALALSCVPAARRLGQAGPSVGYPCLYLVLAALGAQASLSAFVTTPIWLVVGLGIVLCHALLLLAAGRLLRLPLGILATASQANVGGVVSAPLVGAVYHQALAPIGLLLAMAGNAAGTYLGLLAATVCRWAMHV